MFRFPREPFEDDTLRLQVSCQYKMLQLETYRELHCSMLCGLVLFDHNIVLHRLVHWRVMCGT